MRAADLITFWDDAIGDFLAGMDPRDSRPQLARWFAGYRSSGKGRVTTEGMPEPYIGSLTGETSTVVLGLNPGMQDLAFQGTSGPFAAESRAAGSYSGWAATGPYLRAPWTELKGRNKYHELRLAFARRWASDPLVSARHLLMIELYPWHSAAVTGVMAPDPGIVREFVWEPLADLDVPLLFAFGASWQASAEALRLPERKLSVPFTVPSRRLRLFDLPGGQQLVILWHSGSAGPPNATEVGVLKRALQPN